MAAQDAELKLKVSLDLAFFRQQLTVLGQAAAGTPMPVQVRFDRISVQNELNALAANIRKRTYTLNVQTNIKAEIDHARTLAKALDDLSRSRQSAQSSINQRLGVGTLGRKPTEGGIDSKQVEKLYRAAAKAGILVFNREIARTKASTVAALEAVGVDSVKGLLNGLSSENEKIRAAAEYLGENLIKTVKNKLGIASPSREFKKIGQNVGEGFQQGMMSSMDKAFDAVEGLMRARMKVLNTIARGMFRMAGVDPAAIRAEAMQRRALPGVNFPATIPQRNIPIGPSSTGRALPPGASPSALPGTAFGGQKYLPTALGEELKTILRDAANAFVNSLRQNVRSVNVRDLGNAPSRQSMLTGRLPAGYLPGRASQASVLELNNILAGAIREYFKAVASDIKKSSIDKTPLLSAGRQVAGLLPAAGGTTAQNRVRITTGAVLGQPSFMQAPSIPSPMRGGSRGGGGMPPNGGGGGAFGGAGGFGRALGGLNLPGSGTIRELGGEFAYATKQVLLFGQAYKVLSFLQGLPGEVGAAVGQLQSFRNILGAITPSAQEAKASNEVLIGLMEKYNVPLQSARDGFTKLYASMAPTGFSGDEIRNLFTGITKAAATFGMSADKVDRVNYAFAQMASKGQVMSEELKGQLGDVLPGAMAIFAQAAGFKGPKAIQDFSAALEDGAYKGEAMVALLKNVTVVMNNEFGAGAESAALTFQGVMNRMQNSMTLFYESFEPVAVGFLNSVVVPMTNGIKQITDGLNAFLSGTTAKTAGGFAIAQELERLKPAFEGIGQNASALVAQLGQLARAALEVGKILLQIAGNPFVGYLAKVYINILALTTAIQILNLRALIPMIANFGRSVYALIAFTVQCVRAGQSVQVTGLMLRTFFATTGVGLVVVGIGLLIERFMSMNQALEDTKTKALGAAQAIRSMSQTEARIEGQKIARTTKELQKLEASKETYALRGEEVVPVKGDAAKRLEEGGVRVRRDLLGRSFVPKTNITAEILRQQGLQAEVSNREKQIKFEERQSQAPAALATMPAGAASGDDKAERARQKALEDARKLADDKAKYEADLMKMNSLQALDLDQMQFDHWKTLQEQKYNILVAGENSWLAQAIKFQQELQSVEIARIEAVRKAREATAKAEIDAGAKSYVAGAGGGGGGGGGLPAGVTQYITGDPRSPYYQADHGGGNYHEHIAFASRAAAEEAYNKLMSSGVNVTEFKGKGRVGGHTAGSAHYSGLAFDVPAGQVPVGQETALTARVQSILGFPGAASAAGMPASRQRAELKKDYNAALSAQSALNAKEQESLSNKNALVEAQMKITALIKQQVAEITPVEEQKLENQLVQQRIGLLSSGIFGERLDTEAKIAEVTNRATLNIGIAKKKIEENNAIAKEQKWTNEQLTDENKKQLDYISQQEKALSEYIPLLRERLGLEQRTSEAELKGQIQRATPLGGMGLAAGFIGSSADRYKEAIGRGSSKEEATRFAELQNQLTMLETRNEAIQQSILGIGDAFGEAMTTGVASLITGTASAKEAFASFLQSVGQALGQAASQMIATYIAIGIARLFAGFGGGGQGLEPKTAAGNAAFMQRTGALGFANGGVAMGGFKAFANGGVVNGPTLGLVGEGKYNEAIVPLPDGKSIPVQLDSSGIASATSKAIMDRYRPTGSAAIMEKGGAAATDQSQEAQSSPISVNYNVMSVNSMRLVTEDQFQQGLAAAASEGAKRGERNTLQSLQRYRSVRGRVGLS